MDYFSLLGVARHPWLDPEELKEKFHERSVRLHPDIHGTGNGDAFQQLNGAYQTLRDPVRRLRYLLELEAPEMLARIDEMPAPLIAIFMETGQARASLEAFRARHAQASNALAKALLASEKRSLIAELRPPLARIEQAHSEVTSGLQKMQNHTSENLADAYRQLAFLSKWSLQLSDALRELETIR